MAINPINSISPNTINTISNKQIENTESKNNSFNNILKNSINNLNKDINSTQESIEKLISGKSDDFHSYLVQSEKTAANLQLTLQVRNKVVDAYNEIMRMQV